MQMKQNETVVMYRMIILFEDMDKLYNLKDIFHNAWRSIEDIINKYKNGTTISPYEIEKVTTLLAKITLPESIRAMDTLTDIVTSGNYEAEWINTSVANQLWHRAYKEGMFPNEVILVDKLKTKFTKKEKK